MKRRTVKIASIGFGVLALLFVAITAYKAMNCINYLQIMATQSVALSDTVAYIVDECTIPFGMACCIGASAYLLYIFSNLGRK